jgi:hypothetical protein
MSCKPKKMRMTIKSDVPNNQKETPKALSKECSSLSPLKPENSRRQRYAKERMSQVPSPSYRYAEERVATPKVDSIAVLQR